ncbi:FtsX-like permease family protein [Streptomyces sp. NPDC029044]|uniref:FtsX-like permease family protein n=1 Tax=Streptomyces sp. NPDC029044 TaxID=3157198 RepID=UPI0033C9531A
MAAMAVLLTLMLITVAGLSVLNSVVLDTRERIRDLGVCKAIGMSPRQTMSLVLVSVTAIGVIGGLIGVPAGYALHSLGLRRWADHEILDPGLSGDALEFVGPPRAVGAPTTSGT